MMRLGMLTFREVGDVVVVEETPGMKHLFSSSLTPKTKQANILIRNKIVQNPKGSNGPTGSILIKRMTNTKENNNGNSSSSNNNRSNQQRQQQPQQKCMSSVNPPLKKKVELCAKSICARVFLWLSDLASGHR